MQKQISTLAGIIIIVAVAIILFGGVFAYQYFTAKPQSAVQTSQTANWKTYTNAKDGFSIQYPADAQINDGLDSNSPGISFTLPSSSGAPSRVFYIYVATKAWYNFGTPSAVFKSPADCNDFGSNVTTSVNINGANFIKGDVSSASTALRSNATEYCMLKGDIAYKLSPSIQYRPSYGNAADYNAKGFNTTIDVNNDPVLSQMLSTFKFTK